MSDNIHIVPSHNIDRLKWDNCIHASRNAMIYAFSYYLDNMADNWNGIILNDYEVVMPVPWRKKMGIMYCYDVPFIQQLGWFSSLNNFDGDVFLPHLFRLVKYGSYAFNYNDVVQLKAIKQHNNYLIDLSAPHAVIVANYKDDALNNIKKASRLNLSYNTTDCSEAIQYYKRLYAERLSNVSEKDYSNFAALAKILDEKNMVFARQVKDESSGNVLSIALFLRDSRRIYNIMNSTTEDGRKLAANHFLLDNVFREFAGSGLLFDFEGSDIPGIKTFYEKFGARNQPYQKLEKFNHLPFPLNLLK